VAGLGSKNKADRNGATLTAQQAGLYREEPERWQDRHTEAYAFRRGHPILDRKNAPAVVAILLS
jgi:hypothetical protein